MKSAVFSRISALLPLLNLNTVSKTITIRVVDTTGPILVSSNEIIVNLSSPKSLTEILNSLNITDNYDSQNDITREVITENYSLSDELPGQYLLSVRAMDQSGNISIIEINISIVDNVFPIINGPTTFVFSYTELKTVDEILNSLNVSDNLTVLTRSDIVITSDTYSNRLSDVGTYYINIEITDEYNNKTTKQLQIDVIDDQVPVIYVDNILITVSENVTFSRQDALNLLVKNNELENKSYDITIINDDYTGNETIPGKYLYSLRFEDDEGISLQKDFLIEVPNGETVLEDDVLLRNIAIYSVSGLFLLFVIIKKRK